jgi:hypothetical protein
VTPYRLADSLGWDVPAFDEFRARAEAMLAGGYELDDPGKGTATIRA